jgi:hypothetical protein
VTTLVLAEKPSVGRDLAAVLGCSEAGKGYLEGSDYIVTWAIGHLVGLADPEHYDEKFKTWDPGHLPIMPETMRLSEWFLVSHLGYTVHVYGNNRKWASLERERLNLKLTEEEGGRMGKLHVNAECGS